MDLPTNLCHDLGENRIERRPEEEPQDCTLIPADLKIPVYIKNHQPPSVISPQKRIPISFNNMQNYGYADLHTRKNIIN